MSFIEPRPCFRAIASHRVLQPLSLGHKAVRSTWLPALLLDAEKVEERTDPPLTGTERDILALGRARFQLITGQPWSELAHIYEAEEATLIRPDTKVGTDV